MVHPSLFCTDELRRGLGEQHLEFISDTVSSQELVVPNELLDFKEQPWELVFSEEQSKCNNVFVVEL